MGLGALLLTFLAPNFKRRAELLVGGWAVGLGAIGLVMFFAAHLNSFGPSIALFVMVMGWGAWLALVQMDALDFKFVASALRESWLVVCLAVVLILVLGCMTPPLFWDTNVYHVTLPMQYLMWGARIFHLIFLFLQSTFGRVGIKPSPDFEFRSAAYERGAWRDAVAAVICGGVDGQTIYLRRALARINGGLVEYAGGGLRGQCPEV